MNVSLRLFVAVAGAFLGSGCEPPIDPHEAPALVFNISELARTPDGRPVIDIQPNGKEFQRVAPSDRFYLLVRRTGVGYYTRWFYGEDAVRGLRRDLDIPTQKLKPGDKLTVCVEKITGQDATDYLRLSNVLELGPPPPSSAAIRYGQSPSPGVVPAPSSPGQGPPD